MPPPSNQSLGGVKGYISHLGEYYETTNGPASALDMPVPLRPSDTYWYDGRAHTWRNSYGSFEHNYPRVAAEASATDPVQVAITEKRLFSLRDVIYLLGILTSAGGVYFGIISDLREVKTELTIVKSTFQAQQAEIKHCNDKVHELEIENARKSAG